MKNFIFLLGITGGICAEAQILGTVVGAEGCEKPAEVFVAQGKNLLFQIQVPVQGNFEVKLNPGKYDLVAINEEGCEGHKHVVLKRSQINAQIKITKSETTISKRTPNAIASDMASGVSGGFDRNMMEGWGAYASPWWYPWSRYMYPMNSSYPCMWAIWGCNSSYYPSGGPIVMGKPNIYVEGPDVQDARIELDKVEHHKLMATAPAHMEKGWTFSLEKNNLKVHGIHYPYLFYDSRAELDKIPNQAAGFCGSREGILEQMLEELQNMKFPKQAQKDFAEHWIAKLPRLKEFCVYPQVNEQLTAAAPIKTSLDSYSMTRVLFLVIPKPARRDLPKEAFIRDFVKRTPAEWISPAVKASKAKWKIFEWGVAFPFEESKK